MAELKVSFWGVRCRLDEATGTLIGNNWFWEKLITPAVYFDRAMNFLSEMLLPGYEDPGFRFKVLGRLEK